MLKSLPTLDDTAAIEAADYVACASVLSHRTVRVTPRVHTDEGRYLRAAGVEAYKRALMPRSASLFLDVKV